MPFSVTTATGGWLATSINWKSETLTQMLIEPSSWTAKFASFCTSSGSQTLHGMPTTFACCSFLLDELPALVIHSSRLSSSSLIVISTDSGLPSKEPLMKVGFVSDNHVQIIEGH